MSVNPVGVQLSFPRTMFKVSSERSTTMVLLIPIDLLQQSFRRDVGGDRPTVPSIGRAVPADGSGEG